MQMLVYMVTYCDVTKSQVEAGLLTRRFREKRGASQAPIQHAEGKEKKNKE